MSYETVIINNVTHYVENKWLCDDGSIYYCIRSLPIMLLKDGVFTEVHPRTDNSFDMYVSDDNQSCVMVLPFDKVIVAYQSDPHNHHVVHNDYIMNYPRYYNGAWYIVYSTDRGWVIAKIVDGQIVVENVFALRHELRGIVDYSLQIKGGILKYQNWDVRDSNVLRLYTFDFDCNVVHFEKMSRRDYYNKYMRG